MQTADGPKDLFDLTFERAKELQLKNIFLHHSVKQLEFEYGLQIAITAAYRKELCKNDVWSSEDCDQLEKEIKTAFPMIR